MRHGLTDEQWNAIEDIFPEPAMKAAVYILACVDAEGAMAT